jgi:hypothetical protein
MTEQAATTERLSEVTRLATLLADRVLDAQIMSRPIADVQIRALLDAALVLEEHAAPLPPLLMQVLHEIDKFSGQDALNEMSRHSPDDTRNRSGQEKVGSFTRLLRSFRGGSEA